MLWAKGCLDGGCQVVRSRSNCYNSVLWHPKWLKTGNLGLFSTANRLVIVAKFTEYVLRVIQEKPGLARIQKLRIKARSDCRCHSWKEVRVYIRMRKENPKSGHGVRSYGQMNFWAAFFLRKPLKIDFRPKCPFWQYKNTSSRITQRIDQSEN